MPDILISTGRALLAGGGDDLPPEYRDNFGVNGAPGAGWIGTTGAVAGGKLTITPTFGAGNLLTDPGLEAAYAAGLCASLSKSGTPTVAESADVHGGAKAQAFTAVAANNLLYWGGLASVPTDWYVMTLWGKRTAGAANSMKPALTGGGMASGAYTLPITSAAYAQYSTAVVQTITNAALVARVAYDQTAGPAWDSVIIDDCSLLHFDYASMFLAREYKTTEVIAGAVCNFGSTWVYPSPYPRYRFGVVVALDSPTNPQNYVVGYFDGRYFALNKVLGRVETSLVSVQAGDAGYYSWADGEMIEVRRTGNVFSLWYGGWQIGANQTVTDVAIVNNRYVGLYSQSPLASFNDFSVRTYGTDYPIPSYATYTPQTYTAGQAILSLRFDDNDHDAYDYVLGELDSRGLVGTFAMSRGRFYEYTDGGGTQITLANALAIQAAGHEITCHALTHAFATRDWAHWVEETSQAAEEMRRIGFTIWTWMQPGWAVDAVYYLDSIAAHFGQPPEAYLRKYFMAYTATMYAVPASPYWTLPRASHWGPYPGPIYGITEAQAETALDVMIANGTAGEAVWHPQNLGVTEWSHADFETFLDYVEAKVALGDVVVMTCTDQLFATPV